MRGAGVEDVREYAPQQAPQDRPFTLPDLIIATTAELAGATVLHYDQDYDRIAAVTRQPTEWVAPTGSL